MRIIGGEFRGRRLNSPKTDHIRPTTDRMRETIFNILDNRYDVLSGARVLDAFAGTGALGLEALSRGAGHVTFVDKDRRSLDLLSQNIKLLNIQEKTHIQRRDILKTHHTDPFDLIFLDPPYNHKLLLPALDFLHSKTLLSDKSLIVIELSAAESLDVPDFIDFLDDRIYGDSRIIFSQYNF